jgi:hypothetical protein
MLMTSMRMPMGYRGACATGNFVTAFGESSFGRVSFGKILPVVRNTTSRSGYSRRMSTLRARRAKAAAFEPRFFEASPLFWPIAGAARIFAGYADWPGAEALTRELEGRANVRFVPAAPRPRRQRTPAETRPLYDARIVLERCVPTRERSWHDLLNALVWATFPRAKAALHERQLQALRARIVPGAMRLPATRSREHDATALIDEGGVVILHGPGGAAISIVFGHALYEGIVLGVRAMIARAVVGQVPGIPEAAGERVAMADEVLEARLRDTELVPESLPRVSLGA